MDSSPNISAIVSFSRELRNAREFKAISLREVELKTRIASEHLMALESAQWDKIPTGFLRGYVSLYANAVGLNSEKVLRELDTLLYPNPTKSAAHLVANRPLLKQPERVGLTRSKIAAAWFSDLAASTHLKHLITIIALFGLILIPFWLRLRLYPDLPPAIPIDEIVFEYQHQTHGPYTVIPLEFNELPTIEVRKRALWAEMVGIDNGQLYFFRDQEPRQTYQFSNLDTIKIQYLNNADLQIQPGNSATIVLDSTQIMPDSLGLLDLAIYDFHLPDTLSDTTDTLGHQTPDGH
jgi:hypothetical protein